MRLIDADALKAFFDKRYDSAFMQMHTRVNKRYWDGVCAGINWGRNTIADAFTINPEDIRPHGRWITERCNHVPHRFKNPEKWVIHKCSLCGYSNGRKQSNYCPNCGAKMDGKERDNDNT